MAIDLNGPPPLEDEDMPPDVAATVGLFGLNSPDVQAVVPEEDIPGVVFFGDAHEAAEGSVVGAGAGLPDLNMEPDLDQEDNNASGSCKQAL